MTDKNLCPKCGTPLEFEDQSSIGGPKDYWSCPGCGEEQVMFVTKEGECPHCNPDVGDCDCEELRRRLNL